MKNKTDPRTKKCTIWKKIERAIKYDEQRSLLLLEIYGFKLVNGCINIIIDKNGNKYKIPNYCINEPYYERNININEDNVKEEKLNIKFYTYGSKKPIILVLNNKLTGEELKGQYRNYNKIEKKKQIRLFISGIEIKNDQYLYQHKINQEKPIYAIIN